MSEPPRTSGPIDTACRILAAVVGDMTFAIIRREAPPERVRGWIASITEANRMLERKLT